MSFKFERNNKKGLGFSDVLNTLLKNRGITNPAKFLNLSDDVIEDYNKFDNIMLAGYMLLEHLEKDNNIVVLVDSDLDGFSSGTVMYKYLKDVKPDIKLSYITHEDKAHGLTPQVMEKLESMKCDLLIIPDAGSNDFKQHKILSDKGIDIVVLDHHYTHTYSQHACVVNNQMSKNINNKALTGVGVVYKFCKWLDNELKVNFADKYLDVFAIGMIGDSADLTDLESRYLVLKGLELIENGTNKNKFLTEIYKDKAYSMKNVCTISSVAFYMCPSINCIIRGGDAKTKEELFKAFIGSDETFIEKIRGKGEVELSIEEYMVRKYKKLKKLQDKIADEGVALLSSQIEQFGLNANEIIAVNGTELENKTYNRLVVNRLSSKYNKHILLLSSSEGKLRGSGTGARNKEISDFRKWCEFTGLFNFCAGHAGAFGCEMPSENINKLYEVIRTIPSSDILTYLVDEIYNEKSLNKSIVSLVGSYDYIWGNKLDEPLFAIQDVVIPSKDIQLMGKNKNTIKFTFNDIEFIKFKASEDEYNEIVKNENNKFTIIGKFKTNEYGGVTKAQILIENYKFEKSEVVKKFVF